MEPECFLKTAELLNKYDDEAHIRTSISRSFYATFHYFLNYVKPYLSRTPQYSAHRFIADCLTNCTAPQIKKVGARFDVLRQRRRDADYHLDKEISKADGEDALAEAQTIMDDYDEALGQDDKMQQAVLDSITTQGKFKDLL